MAPIIANVPHCSTHEVQATLLKIEAWQGNASVAGSMNRRPENLTLPPGQWSSFDVAFSFHPAQRSPKGLECTCDFLGSVHGRN